MQTTHTQEIARGERFEFGENWRSFLAIIDEDRITQAERSLQAMLGMDNLKDKCFLDIGCGSGLFSLAARRLGASVHSFDYDPQAAACAQELKRRYFPEDTGWKIGIGSILDDGYLRQLGQFDIVYAWGVLHHTGQMWKALEHAQIPVAPQGKLYLAIYNDQGILSRYWRVVKRLYNTLPCFLRVPYIFLNMIPWEAMAALYNLATLRPLRYIRSWTRYDPIRGMSRWHDMVDWFGGYPFEVASRKAIIDFFQARGFELLKLNSVGFKLGCNEFVFERKP